MDMLGGLTATEFLRDYWQKKPLVIRQAFPGFQCPVSQDELAGLACEEAVESRIVIENDAGKPWQLHSAEPPDHLEKTGATAGRGLGEDPDRPTLSTCPGRLLLSPLSLAGECDGRQRGDE